MVLTGSGAKTSDWILDVSVGRYTAAVCVTFLKCMAFMLYEGARESMLMFATCRLREKAVR